MNQTKIGRTEKWIKVEITNTLQLKTKSPQLKSLSITDVKVSRDFSYATILWTSYENLQPEQIAATEVELEKVKGFCRKQLADNSSSYTVPQLRFKYDNTNRKVERINSILDQIKQKS